MKQHALLLILKAWLTGILIYGLITLPALFLPPMYLISLFLGISCSIPGIILFSVFLGIYRSYKTWEESNTILFNLILATSISVFVGTLFATKYYIYQYENNNHFWEAYLSFILFPIAGLLAGNLSIWSFRNSLIQYIQNDTQHKNSHSKHISDSL